MIKKYYNYFMSKFIKLSTSIINTKYINQILIRPNKYYIQLMNSKVDGFFMFGCGGLTLDPEEFVICADKTPDDYKIISEWVKTL